MKSATNVLRTFEVLLERPGAGTSALARHLGVPKSTAQRCVDTLRESGWIERHETGTGWCASARIQTLAIASDRQRLRSCAAEVLAELASGAGESAHLVVRVGDEVELIGRCAGADPVQIVLPLGRRVPIHAGATGKAMLAAGSALPERRPRLTDATIVEETHLAQECAEIRRRGFAVNRGEWHASVGAVAAAILVDGNAIGAVSISTTVARLDQPAVERFGRLVRRAADAIGQSMSGS